MEQRELGSTGISVSQLGLGTGGPSKLGLANNGSASAAREVVETALEEGITLIDTAEAYDTEEIVGAAIEDHSRDRVVLSTKALVYEDDTIRSAGALRTSCEQSLERLGTEYVDIYHAHGVRPADYARIASEWLPELERLKRDGLIRAIGITETVAGDPEHTMLQQVVTDGGWDVVMVGFNLLNHSARERVLEPAKARGIGTIGMVPVRRALADPDQLAETVRALIESGELDPEIDPDDPFDFLLSEPQVMGIIDAAYRFAAYEDGLDTVLCGTSNPEHLKANVASIERGPLPPRSTETLHDRFGAVDSVLGN